MNTNPTDQLAAAIAGTSSSTAIPDVGEMTQFLGVVQTVNGDGTITVTMNGGTVVCQSTIAANCAEGDTVVILIYNNAAWVIGVVSQGQVSGYLAVPIGGLTGATSPTRFVGGTTSGAPTTGTFAKGDFVIDQTGKIWICTAAGTPGTWTQPGGSVTYDANHLTSTLGVPVSPALFFSTDTLAVGTWAITLTVNMDLFSAGAQCIIQVGGGTATMTTTGVVEQSVTLSGTGYAVIVLTFVAAITAAGTVGFEAQATTASTCSIIANWTGYTALKIA